MTGIKTGQKKRYRFMKKWFILLIFPAVCLQGICAETPIKKLSYFRLMGAVVLRSAAGFTPESLVYTTLNHEGGLKVRVLDTGRSDTGDGYRAGGITLRRPQDSGYTVATGFLHTKNSGFFCRIKRSFLILRNERGTDRITGFLQRSGMLQQKDEAAAS